MTSSGELRSPRSRIFAIACLTIAAVFGVFLNLVEVDFSRRQTDAITASQQRFEALKRSLPTQGMVGYVSDRDPVSVDGSNARALAQYSFIPLLLTPAPVVNQDQLDPALRGDASAFRKLPAALSHVMPEWVIGDFHDPQAAPGVARREHLTIVRDFGEGALLLRRVSE